MVQGEYAPLLQSTHTHKLSLNSIQNVQMQVQRCDSMLTGTYRVHIPTGLFSWGTLTEEHNRTPEYMDGDPSRQ